MIVSLTIRVSEEGDLFLLIAVLLFIIVGSVVESPGRFVVLSRGLVGSFPTVLLVEVSFLLDSLGLALLRH